MIRTVFSRLRNRSNILRRTPMVYRGQGDIQIIARTRYARAAPAAPVDFRQVAAHTRVDGQQKRSPLRHARSDGIKDAGGDGPVARLRHRAAHRTGGSGSARVE